MMEDLYEPTCSQQAGVAAPLGKDPVWCDTSHDRAGWLSPPSDRAIQRHKLRYQTSAQRYD